MDEIKRKDVDEKWADATVIEAGDFVFIGYCMGNEGKSIESQINGAFDVLEERLVLDLGCGTGIFTFLLEAYEPERLIGIDLSEKMLAIAKKKAVSRASKAEFMRGDAADIMGKADRKFDFIFSSTMTHYIENLNALFKGIADCLEEGGKCILSLIHPVYSAMYPVSHGETFPEDDEWQVRYLDQRLRAYIQPWIEYNDACENHLSVSYHHLFGDYVNAAVTAGLRICGVHEPMPPESWKTEFLGRYQSFLETPTYMIVELVTE